MSYHHRAAVLPKKHDSIAARLLIRDCLCFLHQIVPVTVTTLVPGTMVQLPSSF